MFHTQPLCRALQLEPILAVKSGYRAFEENPSTGGPEAILWDAWVSTYVKVIKAYIDGERKKCLRYVLLRPRVFLDKWQLLYCFILLGSLQPHHQQTKSTSISVQALLAGEAKD
jgi:hypothetical protein